MRKVHVAPSILAADFSRIEEEVAASAKAGATFIHLDVMDGQFVPNKTFDADLVAKIVPFCGLMIRDTHLMVFHPDQWIDRFAKAGSQLITFHYEAYETDEERLDCIAKIHAAGLQAGMSIKPCSGPEKLVPFLPHLELVLVMSVEPGKGGQAFLPEALGKVAFLRKEIDALGKAIYLEIDGGINGTTAPLAVKEGADVLVAGSYLYGHEDFKQRVESLMELGK